MKALTKRLLALGASSVIAVSGAYLVAPWEGSTNQAYRDMVGVPTLCHGYTIGVKMGDYKTDEECEEILAKELTHFNTQMMKSVKVPLPEHMEVAYTSLVWNIGIGAWNSSTLLKKLNNKEYVEACKQILRWNKAGGRVVKGLQNRREAEYKVCMGENADVNKALNELTLSGQEPLSVGINGLKTIKNDKELPTPQLEEIDVSSHDAAGSKGVSGDVDKSSCSRRFLGILWCSSFN